MKKLLPPGLDMTQKLSAPARILNELRELKASVSVEQGKLVIEFLPLDDPDYLKHVDQIDKALKNNPKLKDSIMNEVQLQAAQGGGIDLRPAAGALWSFAKSPSGAATAASLIPGVGQAGLAVRIGVPTAAGAISGFATSEDPSLKGRLISAGEGGAEALLGSGLGEVISFGVRSKMGYNFVKKLVKEKAAIGSDDYQNMVGYLQNIFQNEIPAWTAKIKDNHFVNSIAKGELMNAASDYFGQQSRLAKRMVAKAAFDVLDNVKTAFQQTYGFVNGLRPPNGFKITPQFKKDWAAFKELAAKIKKDINFIDPAYKRLSILRAKGWTDTTGLGKAGGEAAKGRFGYETLKEEVADLYNKYDPAANAIMQKASDFYHRARSIQRFFNPYTAAAHAVDEDGFLVMPYLQSRAQSVMAQDLQAGLKNDFDGFMNVLKRPSGATSPIAQAAVDIPAQGVTGTVRLGRKLSLIPSLAAKPGRTLFGRYVGQSPAAIPLLDQASGIHSLLRGLGIATPELLKETGASLDRTPQEPQ